MIWVLLGCSNGKDRPVAASPMDTALDVCALPPLVAHVEGQRVPEVRLYSEWSLQAGYAVRILELDGDRCLELVLGETRNDAATYPVDDTPLERLVILDAALSSGPLSDAGRLFAESGYTEEEGATEDGEMGAFANFGWDVAVDATNDALLVGARVNYDDFDVGSFSLQTSALQEPQDAMGLIRASRRIRHALLHTHLGVVERPGVSQLWSGTYETTGSQAFAGQVYVFDLPLQGAHDERDARALYRADAGDYVQFGVSWETDLDGDGVAELVMGAKFRHEGKGAVALLSDPPDGEHPIWDLAVATIAGEVPEGRLGEQVVGGDLDGDGQAELLTGAAMIYGSSRLHVFRGPLQGERLASSSEWTVEGPHGLERTGASSAVADLDGDGAMDLVVGEPGNSALGALDGSVLFFQGPLAPGTYPSTEAHLVVRNPRAAGTGDAFGHLLRTGDLNADGTEELVISAPRDPQDGHPVGSVQVLYGRGDFWAL